MPDIFTSDEEEKKVERKVGEFKSSRNGASGRRKFRLSTDPMGLIPGFYKHLYSFGYKPNGVKFETQDELEYVVLFLRKHPITNLKWLLITFLMFLAPSLLALFPGVGSIPETYQIMFLLSWYAVTLTFALQSFMRWFFDVLIVTDERIVDVDYNNIIHKEVTDAALDKIQDVTYKVAGVAKTVIDYGDVLVQTASEIPNLDMIAVPKPAAVVKVLQELREEEEEEKMEGRVR